MSIGKFFRNVGNAVKDVAKAILPAPVKIGMAVVDKLTGNKGSSDPEAARQAEEDRKFTEEMNAQTAQINAQTAQMQAENEKIFGLLGNMQAESGAMFQAARGGPPAGAGLPADFVGKDLFERYSNPQALGAPNAFGPPQGPSFGDPTGMPPDIARALQQYGLDLNTLRMS